MAQSVSRDGVPLACSQWWHHRRDRRQPEVRVDAESPLGHEGSEVRLRGGGEFDVHGLLGDGAPAAHALGLEGGEQLALQQQGQRIDRVILRLFPSVRATAAIDVDDSGRGLSWPYRLIYFLKEEDVMCKSS
jgi:hypothetical protein